MIQFDPEHLRIAAKLREQERRRWRKQRVEMILAFTVGLLFFAAAVVMPFVLWNVLVKWFG